jgi:hypothetical protein
MITPWQRIVDVALTDLTSRKPRPTTEPLPQESPEAARAREQAERAAALDRTRKAGEHELLRLRWIMGLSIVSWIGALVVSVLMPVTGIGARIVLGAGWLSLIGAMITSLVAQLRISEALNRTDQEGGMTLPTSAAGGISPSLIVVGLGLVIVATVL